MGLAAAAYNAGEQRVADWQAAKRDLPVETEDYVAFVTGHAAAEWRLPAATFAAPGLGGTGDFAAQCQALAMRSISLGGSSYGMALGPVMPWGVMLATSFDARQSIAMFRRLKLRFPKLLEGRRPMLVRKRNLSRGSKKMAMLMIGTGSRPEATALCASFTAAGLPCLVRKSR
jgi:hypothetical protein